LDFTPAHGWTSIVFLCYTYLQYRVKGGSLFMNNTLNRVQNSTSTKLAIGGFIWLLIFALAFKIFPGTSFFFPFISLWANISLFITACAVLKLSKVRFDIFHVVVILVLWAASFLYFYWALNRRNFIYI